MKSFKKLGQNQKGQSLVEYLVLVALIAVGSIAVVRVVGQNIATQYENINRSLGASKKTQLSVKNAASSAYSKKDLGNFLSGANSSGGDSGGSSGGGTTEGGSSNEGGGGEGASGNFESSGDASNDSSEGLRSGAHKAMDGIFDMADNIER